MSFDQLPVNFFDLAFVGILVLGVLAGRKNGMSGEFFMVLTWLTVVLVAGFTYGKVADLIVGPLHVSRLTANILAYLAVATLVVVCGHFLRSWIGGGLAGSDFFGQAEYFLGMTSGLVRYACVLVAALSVLNARYYSPMEVKAMETFQNDVYGSNLFPTWHTAQSTVFDRSLVGPVLKRGLKPLLIQPTQVVDTRIRQKDAALPY